MYFMYTGGSSLTSILFRRRCAWCTSRRLGDDTEVIRCAALPPNVTANVQRAGIQLGPVVTGSQHGFLCPRGLRPTDSIGDRRGERRRPCAETYLRLSVQRIAAIPAPCIFVEIINLFLGKSVGRSKKITAIIWLNCVYKARPIVVRLGGNIRQLSVGTANWLASRQRAKVLVIAV